MSAPTAEHARLIEGHGGGAPWLRWGPYLSERQWGTVREDYSPGGDAWSYLPHDHARSRAYRWGEDGIAGLSDEAQRLCFALSLWNGRDAILKERLFGLTNEEGVHGEDVKECYFFQDATPTHSQMAMLYKYPQAAFPYAALVEENARRKREEPGAFEYELIDTGAFDGDRYFDVAVTYAKRGPEDVLIRVVAANRGPDAAPIWLLPTLWLRNTWSWNGGERPELVRDGGAIEARHPELGTRRLVCEGADDILFCDNESNAERLWGRPGPAAPKDGIGDHVMHGSATVRTDGRGTKAAALWRRDVPAGGSIAITLRLTDEVGAADLGPDPDAVFAARAAEADAFYDAILPDMPPERRRIARQAHAGMLWSKQYYEYDVARWLDGDAIPSPEGRRHARNARWRHFDAADVISMPDTWEYPWFASWDLCFHAVVLARTDIAFAKRQVMLLCREWYMSPDGQVPAYEWNFDDLNPPLQVWAALQIARHERAVHGAPDTTFLREVFQHGLVYFTWWVNREDADGNDLFQGGFLGLDNISAFDRSAAAMPGGGRLYQSDGTTWVGFFALQMMELAAELSSEDPSYRSMALKFLTHFLRIADAMDHLHRESEGRADLWDDSLGLFVDVLRVGEEFHPIRIRSLVGLLPMIAVGTLDLDTLAEADDPVFAERLAQLRVREAALLERGTEEADGRLLVSFLDEARLHRMLAPLLDEAEFLSPHGIRSLSRRHATEPFALEVGGQRFEATYWPAESPIGMFGGNSNWRGPVWMPINYLLIDALRDYHRHFGEGFTVECPTGSGQRMTLGAVADEIARRLVSIWEPDAQGRRPVNGGTALMQDDPRWSENLLFYEYFHGDEGAGLGASHQTGWTGLVAVLAEALAQDAHPVSTETFHA